MLSVAGILSILLNIVSLILIAYVILSWVEVARRVSRNVPHIDPGNPVVRFIERFAYTILHPLRRMLSPYQRDLPLDLSVIVAFVLIQLIRIVIVERLPF